MLIAVRDQVLAFSAHDDGATTHIFGQELDIVVNLHHPRGEERFDPLVLLEINPRSALATFGAGQRACVWIDQGRCPIQIPRSAGAEPRANQRRDRRAVTTLGKPRHGRMRQIAVRGPVAFLRHGIQELLQPGSLPHSTWHGQILIGAVQQHNPIAHPHILRCAMCISMRFCAQRDPCVLDLGLDASTQLAAEVREIRNNRSLDVWS
mmetsp:Transcript_80540/g.204710  ORF Transcript_80540/g.204710 Transcript_80540/m.204710 type:complete len:207 (-) Transcript_80540:179-799(-)